MIILTVPGKVRGKQRPRFTRTGHTYTPNETVNYENLIKTLFMHKYPNFIPLETPLLLTVTAYFKKAKSNKMKQPCVKPDIDNIIKCVDALNGLAFLDDKQIIGVTAYKMFDNTERLELRIEEA